MGELHRLLAPLDGAASGDHAAQRLEEEFARLAYERWRETADLRALSAGQLELFYRLKWFIPRRAQLAARRVLIRRQGLPEFPSWPYDDSVHALLGRYAHQLGERRGEPDVAFRWFWPGGMSAAAILTHDVESAEGLRMTVEVADLEERHGLRSSFNVVADWYPIDYGIVEELRSRGFEIGVHGVHHDRSLFSTREEFDRQLPVLRDAAERLGARGFRSPATHRVDEWLHELPVEYDCTIPHSDPYEPQPGGCCSVWPYFLGDVVELPYTVPQDHTAFTLLREPSIALWRDQAERLIAANGLIQVVSHPDPGYLGNRRIRARYDEFLGYLAQRDGIWKALPIEVARWWRDRDAARGDWVRGIAETGRGPDAVAFRADQAGTARTGAGS